MIITDQIFGQTRGSASTNYENKAILIQRIRAGGFVISLRSAIFGPPDRLPEEYTFTRNVFIFSGASNETPFSIDLLT